MQLCGPLAGEIERLREVVKACHKALFQAWGGSKDVVRQRRNACGCGAGRERNLCACLTGHRIEDVAAINDWHKMAADALSAWENRS